MIRINRLAPYLSALAVVAFLPGASAFAEMSTLNGTLLGLVRTQNLASRSRVTSIEGTVESIKSDGVTLRTASGTVRLYATGNTPVNYKGDRYSVVDLERGDTVRASVKSRGDHEYDARSFEVLRSVSDSSATDDVMDVSPESDFITGQVVKIDDRLGTFRLDTDNGRTITVDAYGTNDFRRGQNWLYDLRSGDRIRVNGRFTDANVYKATTMKLVSRGEYDNGDRSQIKPNRDYERKRDDRKNKDDDDDDDDD